MSLLKQVKLKLGLKKIPCSAGVNFSLTIRLKNCRTYNYENYKKVHILPEGLSFPEPRKITMYLIQRIFF